MTTSRSILLALLVPLAACDAQVDGDSQGTALARLQGNVSSARADTPVAADVAVIWRKWRGAGLISGGIEPVEGRFPSEFSLSIYEPPPAAMLNTYLDEGVQFAVAYIEAVEPGQTEFLYPAPQALGMDFDHLLVYVPADVRADSFVATFLHSAPSAGFHLYGAHHLTPEERSTRQACIYNGPSSPMTLPEIYERCGGDDYAVDFVPLPSDLDTPLSVELVDVNAIPDRTPTW